MNSKDTFKFTKDFFEKQLDKQDDVEEIYRQMADDHLYYNELITKKKIK